LREIWEFVGVSLAGGADGKCTQCGGKTFLDVWTGGGQDVGVCAGGGVLCCKGASEDRAVAVGAEDDGFVALRDRGEGAGA